MEAMALKQPLTRILVLGDSLSAGYGLSKEEAFPSRLERALRLRGHSVEVINAGVSGDTTAGGLSRLDWALADNPDLVILELGANDALRGLPPRVAEENLDAMLARLRKRGVKVILTGMKAPRNWGPEYHKAFDAIFPRLAQKYQVPLYPFFLEGVAGEASLNLPDGLHPNARGVARIVEGILLQVEALLAEQQRPGTQAP